MKFLLCSNYIMKSATQIIVLCIMGDSKRFKRANVKLKATFGGFKT